MLSTERDQTFKRRRHAMVTFHDDDDDEDTSSDSDYKEPRRQKAVVGAKRKREREREARRAGEGTKSGSGGRPAVAALASKSPPSRSHDAFVIPVKARRSYMTVRINTVNVCEAIQNGDLVAFGAALEQSRPKGIDFAEVTTTRSSPLLDSLKADFHGLLDPPRATKFHETHRLEMIRAILGHPTTRAPFSVESAGTEVLVFAVSGSSEAVFRTLVSDQRLKPEHWESIVPRDGKTVFNSLVGKAIHATAEDTAETVASRLRQWDARVASIVPLVSERALNLPCRADDDSSPLAYAVSHLMVQTVQAMSRRYEELDVVPVRPATVPRVGIGIDHTNRSFDALVGQKTMYYRTLLPCVTHATQLLDVLAMLVVQFLVPAQADTAVDLSLVFPARK